MDLFKAKIIVTLIASFQFIYHFGIVASAPGIDENGAYMFTRNETLALERFRDMFDGNLYEDYMKDDIYLIRWIRDQNFNLEKASDKLNRHLKWRKENRVDSVLHEDFSDILRDCPFDLTGKDMEGRPILASSMRKCHLRKIILRGKTKLDRATIYLMEKMYQIGRDSQGVNGKYPQTGIIISDMAGLSLREHTCIACFSFFVTLFDIYTNHYPELISDIYVINIPRFAVAFIAFLVPLAPPNFRETVYPFGFDRSEWEAAIRQKVEVDQLTHEFGGTKSRKPTKHN